MINDKLEGAITRWVRAEQGRKEREARENEQRKEEKDEAA